MNRHLNIDQILVFNDYPELFKAIDSIGQEYLCLCIKYNEFEYEYCCVSVSKKRYASYLSGKIDLRDVFEKPELKEWWFTNDTSEQIINIELYTFQTIPQEYLPTVGYFHSKENNEEGILEEVVEHNNVVVHLSLSDNSDRESISVNDLALFSGIYQTLLENCYKKTVEKTIKKHREVFVVPNNYTLRAFSSSPGSFVLHLMTESSKDLFGKCLIEDGLIKIDSIISDASNQEEIINILRTVKGHSISNYKRLIQLVISKNVTFKYKWCSPSSTNINQREITKVYAEKVLEILNQKNDLEEEIVQFSGYVKQADVDKGTWRITNSEDNKDYSGETLDSNLKGITLNTKLYKFICNEILEYTTITETTKKKYILKSIEEVI